MRTGDTQRHRPLARQVALALLLLPLSGCMHGLFSTDPYAMPEVLKAEMERAQQSASALRSELERLQNELAVSRIAKAQLEGSLRDAERRVSESRQVIEFQREELSRARGERERVMTTGKDLQAQLTALQAQLGEQTRLQQQLVQMVNRPVKPAPTTPVRKTARAPAAPKTVRGIPLHQLALLPPPESAVDNPTPVRKLAVHKGDTLHSISRQYGVDVAELASLNNLTAPDRLLVGQVLVLPSGAQDGLTPAEVAAEAEPVQAP